MKKLAAAALTITMALSMSTPAYATEINGVTNGSQDIKVTYETGTMTTDTVYSVDVEWGSLEYTYHPAATETWNPNTLKYEISTGKPYWDCEKDANKIKVVNNSNTEITAKLTYVAGNNSGVSGSFDKAQIGLKSAEGTAREDSPNDAAYLSLSGALTETATELTTVGNVNVTISDFIGENSNYKWDGNGGISWGILQTTMVDKVYTVQKTYDSGSTYYSSLFYIYNKDDRSERYGIKDGTITKDGVYALKKIASDSSGNYGFSLPLKASKTIRLTFDLRDENNLTLTVKTL